MRLITGSWSFYLFTLLQLPTPADIPWKASHQATSQGSRQTNCRPSPLPSVFETHPPEYHSSSAANYLLCLPSFPTPIYSGPHRSWSSNIFPPTQIFIPAPSFSRLSLGTLWPFLPGKEVWSVEKQECDLQIFTLSPHLHIPSLVSCLALQQTECSWILLTIWPHSQRSKQILKEHLALLSPVNSSRPLL